MGTTHISEIMTKAEFKAKAQMFSSLSVDSSIVVQFRFSYKILPLVSLEDLTCCPKRTLLPTINQGGNICLSSVGCDLLVRTRGSRMAERQQAVEDVLSDAKFRKNKA